MSKNNMLITERNNTSLYGNNENTKVEKASKVTKSYQYVYTNTSNKTNKSYIENKSNITTNSNNLGFNKVNSKCKYIPRRKLFSSENITNQSPSKLKCNVETNYSINTISNVKYINGSNQNISNINYIRNPDLKFMNFNNNEKLNIAGKNNKIVNNEYEEKCLCDQNANCTCGKRKYNRYDRQLYEESKVTNLKQGNNKYLNHDIKFIKKTYYENDNNTINNTNYNNIYNKKYIKNYEKTQNFEKNTGFFSDEDIKTESKSKLNTYNKLIRYSSPKYFSNNRNIKITSYYNQNNNTIDSIKETINNINNINVCNCLKNRNELLKKRNHNFKSISNCSYNNINTNNMKTYYSKKNKKSNRNYQYDIRIHNINIHRMNRSFSYENFKNNRRYDSSIYSPAKYNRERITSYDKRQLKMQNAQSMQVLQDEKIFQLLVPIPPNKIENSCDFQISSKSKKKYLEEEINEITKRNNITKEEYINEEKDTQNFNNNVKKEITVKTKNNKIKPNWNKTNRLITTDALSYDLNKHLKNKNNKTKNVDVPKNIEKIDKKNELNVENFEINIADNGRKFRGEMCIENNEVEYEKQEKNPNSNLLLSPNAKFYLNADYPKKDWNNITKPISGRPLSIESKNKKILLERSAEKLSIKGNKPKNDWNLSNNEEKEINIILYQKKRQNLLKDKMNHFVIKGKKKNFNLTTNKENEVTFKGMEKTDEIIDNDEEEIINNDDYNRIEKNKNYGKNIKFNIKKINNEISEESSSELDILKNLKIHNNDLNDYKSMIIETINSPITYEQKVIINNITGKYPKGIEIYHEKEESHDSRNITNNNVYKTNLYSKKIINNKKYLQLKVPKTPEKVETKRVYREIITNKQEPINDKDYENNINNISNINNDLQKTDYKEKTKSETNTPKSQTKYSYREQIIASSPNHSENQDNNNIKKVFSNKSNSSYFFENQEDISKKGSRPQSIYTINSNLNNINKDYININNKNQNEEKENNNYYYYNQNQNQIQNNINNIQKNANNQKYYFNEKTEQQIPSLREEDEEPHINNINNYNQEKNEKSPVKQGPIQYIYKKEKINSVKSHINQTITNQQNNQVDISNNNIINVENLINNGEKKQIINQQKVAQIEQNNNNNKLDDNNNYNNINYQQQKVGLEQQNIIVQGRLVQSQIITPNREIINQEYMNRNEISGKDNININVNNSGIINTDYLKKINNFNNLNNSYFQQPKIELSQSQEIPQSSIQSISKNNKKNNYGDLIKEYSYFLKNNPIDNYNNFATNRYNIIPMSAGKYGNIILNNTLSSSKRYYNNRNSQENLENNQNIQNNNLKTKNSSIYTFTVNSNEDKNNMKIDN